MATGNDAEPKQPETEATEVSVLSHREQVEKERLTRRAALRKFGFGAGMAALMALSVDELARIAARKMERNAGDNKLANAVATEFKNAGVAFAGAAVANPSAVPWQDLPFSPACQACYINQGIEYDKCGDNLTCKNTVNTNFANCYSAAHCNFNYGN